MIFAMKIKKQQFAQFTLCSRIKSTHKTEMGLDDFLSQSIASMLAFVAYEGNRKYRILRNTLLKRLTDAKFSITKHGGLKSHGS